MPITYLCKLSIQQLSDLMIQNKNQFCLRHEQKAYHLCMEDKCDLPILICNECSETDHLHLSIPIKKVETIFRQKNNAVQESDEITNTIRGFYHDLKETLLAQIEKDETRFIQEFLDKESENVDSSIKLALKAIKEKKYQMTNSNALRKALEYLKNKGDDKNIEVQVPKLIERKMNFLISRTREMFAESKDIGQGKDLNWEFVTAADNKKIADPKTARYKIQNDCNIVGNVALKNKIHKWRIVFTEIEGVGCLGFGIGSLDTINKADISQNSILSCLCCNGPWSGTSFDIKHDLRIKEKLTLQDRTITFELNNDKKTIVMLDPKGRVHGEKCLNILKSMENLIPVVKRGGSAKVEFRLQIIE